MRLHLLILVVCCCAAAVPSLAAAGVRVEVRGLGGAEQKNVETRLRIRAAQETDEAYVRRLHRAAEDDIRAALQAYGYYSPKIHAELSGTPPDWTAVYDIDPGPETRITRLGIELTGAGRDSEALQKVRQELPLRTGERLLHENYEHAKERLIQAAYEQGYIDAAYTVHELRVEVAQQQAAVLLTLETGPRYFFGNVILKQQQGLDDEFLMRYVPINPGAAFDPKLLLTTQFHLSDLDYFSLVEVQPQRDQGQDNHIPIVITTKPRAPHRYDVGVGYGTDTGARLTLGTEFRQLNSKGHKLRAEARLSQVKNTVGVEYRIPQGDEALEYLGFSSAFTQEELADGDSRRYELGTSFLRTPGAWQRRIYLNYLREEFGFHGSTDRHSDLLMPGLSVSIGQSDDAINARRGWYLFLDTHGADKLVISDTRFVQSRLLSRAALPLGERGRLLLRGELGASVVAKFSELPASQRFFAGGDQSVRGYAYQSLGPRDANGQVIGGKFLTTGSVETEYLVWREWGVAAFLDVGNAYDTPGTRLFRGIGAGVRYRAPIGTLQVDVAHPLDGDTRGVRLHIGIRVGV